MMLMQEKYWPISAALPQNHMKAVFQQVFDVFLPYTVKTEQRLLKSL